MYSINEHHEITLGLQLPLIGFLNRPQYTIDEQFYHDINFGGNLLKYVAVKPIGANYFQVIPEFTYKCKLSRHWQLAANLRYNYYSIGYPERVRNMTSVLLVNINYLF